MRSGSERARLGSGGALLAPGPPPSSRQPLPGPVARSYRCNFARPSGWGALCHPRDTFHWDLALRGTGILGRAISSTSAPCSPSGWGPSLMLVRRRAELSVHVCPQVIQHLSVARPCRPGPALCHTPVLQHFVQQAWGRARGGGQGGPCMSSVSFPCSAALFPQGKFRTLRAVRNKPSFAQEPTPGPGQGPSTN